jgi:hypothetical protein
MEEESENEIAMGEELIVFSAEADYENLYDEYYLLDVNDINVSLLWSDWLADSAIKSHITNHHDILSDYVPTLDLMVTGVGSVNAAIKGRGTVVLNSEYEGHKYNLQLENVLYIPTSKNNILSLGRWEGGRPTICWR